MMHILAAQAQVIANLLIQRKETIAVAESSTGGLIAASLLSLPGASKFFVGGAVVYTKTARDALLGITDNAMHGMRPSTEPYAALLAQSIRERLGTTWALGETGACGPTGNRYGDPAGHACLAINGPQCEAWTFATNSTDREGNMQAFAKEALHRFALRIAQA